MKATTNATFEFRTLTEAREIAAHLSSLAKDPSKIIMGLTALMVNAIEHGNLEIGHDKKQELLVSGTWEEEIEKRLELPENKDKTVKVEFERGDEEVKIRIKDQGKGFEWQKFIDFEPIRMTDPNGRGIAVANITNPGCIEFIGDGSEVLYTIKL